METTSHTYHTGNRPVALDITMDAGAFCADRGDGLLSVFVPHATAGIAIFETGAGSDTDVLAALESLLPPDSGRWHHAHGSPGHGRDHVVPAFVSPSITVPVQNGIMSLGTWQSLVLVDTNVDNSTREVRFSFLAG